MNTKKALILVWLVLTIAVIALVVSMCVRAHAGPADSYVYYGMYTGDSNIPGYPGDLKGTLKYHTGIRIERTAISNDGISLIPFLENEILIDKMAGWNFSPSSANFLAGIKLNIENVTVKIQHECRHGFGDRTKLVEQYNLIELQYHLGNK